MGALREIAVLWADGVRDIYREEGLARALWFVAVSPPLFVLILLFHHAAARKTARLRDAEEVCEW